MANMHESVGIPSGSLPDTCTVVYGGAKRREKLNLAQSGRYCKKSSRISV